MDVQELRNPEMAIWVKYLTNIANKMNNINSSMIDMKPKAAVNLDIFKLEISETLNHI